MDEIESIEQLAQMKESLRKSLFEVWNCKVSLIISWFCIRCIVACYKQGYNPYIIDAE